MRKLLLVPCTQIDTVCIHIQPISVDDPCYAEVSSDRTNLSPFTKDYRGLALEMRLISFCSP